MSGAPFRSVPCRECGGTGNLSRVNPAWLRSVREASGKSLRVMAQELKLSPAYISDIELGRRPLHADHRIFAAYELLICVPPEVRAKTRRGK